MEKPNGTYDLVIWNEPTLWNETTKSAVTAPTSAVKVNLGATYGVVKVYDPLVGTTAVQTLINTATVHLALSRDRYIIEVTPDPVAPASKT